MNGRSCAVMTRTQTAIAVENSPNAIADVVRLSLCTMAIAARVQIAWMMSVIHLT
jgi:hypothetical protein